MSIMSIMSIMSRMICPEIGHVQESCGKPAFLASVPTGAPLGAASWRRRLSQERVATQPHARARHVETRGIGLRLASRRDGAPMANQCSYQGHVPARLPQGNPRVAPPRPAARVRDAIAAARRHAARDGRFVEVNVYGLVSAKDREVQPLAPCQEGRDLQAGRRPGISERTFGAPLPDPFRVPLLGPLSRGPYELPN